MADIRVFVSIPVSDVTALGGVMSDLRSIKGVRVSPPEHVHITLRFIGDVDESKVDDIERCVKNAVFGKGVFTVSLCGAGAFFRHSRPSVVWIGADPHDRLKEMANAVGRSLRAAGIPFNGKPFKSHVTVGRCRGPVDLSGFFDAYSDREFTSFECGEILVMRSVFGQSEALYSVLRRVPLT